MAKPCFDQLTELYKTQIDKGMISPQQIKDILVKAEELRTSNKYATDFKKLKEQSAHQIMQRIEYKASKIASRVKLETLRNTEGIRPGTNDIFKVLSTGLDNVVRGGNDSFQRAKENFASRIGYRLDSIKREWGEVATSGDHDLEIGKAIWAHKEGKGLDGFSDPIRKVAVAIVSHNKKLIQELREMGVNIQERADFMFRQTHSADKLSAVKEGDWVKKIRNSIDVQKTFESDWTPAVEGKVRKIYQEITSGSYENSVGMFGGSRTFVFDGPEKLVSYNQEFGTGTIFETLNASGKSAAKAGAAGRTIGIAAKENWEWIEKTELAKITDPKKRDDFMSTKVGLFGVRTGLKAERDIMFKEMFGYDRIPSSDMVAKTYRALSLANASARLSGAIFSTFGDFAGAAWGMRSATGDLMPELGMIRNFFQTIHPGDRDIMARHLEIHISESTAEIHDRMGTFSHTRGGSPLEEGRDIRSVAGNVLRVGGNALAWGQKVALKANMLEIQNVGSKLSTARYFAERLASQADKSFADLAPEYKASMDRYNIGEKEWDTLRPLQEEIALATGDPMKLITPEAIRNAGHGDLGNRYGSMLQDMGRTFLMEAQARERGIVGHGLGYNDPRGAFVRLTSQFQGTALSVDRVLRRIGLNDKSFKSPDLLSRQALKEAWNAGNANHLKMVSGAIVQVTIFTAAGMALKDMTKNREPKLDKEFFMDAFTRGATPLVVGYGLDILRAKYAKDENGFKTDLLERLAGPTMGQAKAAVEIVGLTVKDGVNAIGDILGGRMPMTSEAAQPALKFLLNNFPAILGVAWPIIQKSILEELNDYWNPGYTARAARRARKRGDEKLFD